MSNGNGKRPTLGLVKSDGTPMAEPVRVMIALPVQAMCASGFAYDLARLVGFSVSTRVGALGLVENVRLECSEGTLIAPQRSFLAKRALETGATHVLWLDTDMRFPKDTLLRLLGHSKPVVAGSYPSRRIPVRTVAFASIGELHKPEPKLCYTTDDKHGLEQVAAVGMGCMLTETAVFTKTEFPWFTLDWTGASYSGEDIAFCRKLTAASIPIYVDHDLSRELRHVGVWEFTHRHALVHKDLADMEPEQRQALIAEADISAAGGANPQPFDIYEGEEAAR